MYSTPVYQLFQVLTYTEACIVQFQVLTYTEACIVQFQVLTYTEACIVHVILNNEIGFVNSMVVDEIYKIINLGPSYMCVCVCVLSIAITFFGNKIRNMQLIEKITN